MGKLVKIFPVQGRLLDFQDSVGGFKKGEGGLRSSSELCTNIPKKEQTKSVWYLPQLHMVHKEDEY